MKKIQTPPFRLLAVTLLAVFFLEITLTLSIHRLAIPSHFKIILEASLLIFLLYPVLYFTIFKPLNSNMLKLVKSKNSHETMHNMLLSVLDSLDAIVYVADINTYELLFLNKYSKDIFGDAIGKRCWEVLQTDQTGPCEFCSNDKLLSENGEPSGMYSWEFQNTVNNHWYDIRDRAIKWIDGRTVRLEIATDVTDRKRTDREKEKLITKLQDALTQVKTLQGILPICSHCKKIRNDEGSWNQLEAYVTSYTEAQFSHGICPECMQQHYPEAHSKIYTEDSPPSGKSKPES
jgi:hypothetical protein